MDEVGFPHVLHFVVRVLSHHCSHQSGFNIEAYTVNPVHWKSGKMPVLHKRLRRFINMRRSMDFGIRNAVRDVVYLVAVIRRCYYHP